MAGFKPVDRMSKPTGPSDILKSNRPMPKAGGRRVQGSGGIVKSPGRTMSKRIGRR